MDKWNNLCKLLTIKLKKGTIYFDISSLNKLWFSTAEDYSAMKALQGYFSCTGPEKRQMIQEVGIWKTDPFPRAHGFFGKAVITKAQAWKKEQTNGIPETLTGIS